MKILDEKVMKNLSFPDFDVEKIEFFPKDKKLKIYIEGAWLDVDGGSQLGRGILYFNDWENFLVSRFDPDTEQWLLINVFDIEPLKDLCEVKFNNETICLYGFGKRTGHWIEWKIQKTKMCAEFDT
ncbi:MAG: hypothetical protein K1000chlam3_00074 [Chlamydiae bacterium]|nr:hypothetical protein [Chlamydiota bacterium]